MGKSDSTTSSPHHESDGSQRLTMILVACVVCLGHGPLLVSHFWTLWAQPQYQYFPFVLLAFAYLLSQRVREANSPTSKHGVSRYFVCRAGIGLGWLLLLLAVVLYDPWLGMLSIVCVAAPILHFYLGSRGVINLFGIWCLLWLLLPPPRGLDQAFISRLQLYSSILSSHLLDLLHIDHLMSGNVLRLPNKEFFVDEACSGIISIMSVIACGGIYCVWANRSLMHSTLLLVVGIGWAVVLNVTRISTIAIAFAGWEIDLSHGAVHDILGLVLFMFTFTALMGSDQLLSFALQPVSSHGIAQSEATKNPLVRQWNRFVMFCTPGASRVPAGEETVHRQDHSGLVGPVVCVAFCALGVANVVGWGLVGARPTIEAVAKTASINGESWKTASPGWDVISFESVDRGNDHGGYGEYSKSFLYENPTSGIDATASIDYPYRGSWHELTTCYELSGWTLVSRSVEGVAEEGWGYVEARFFNETTKQHGLLLFSMIDDTGELLSPPANTIVRKIWQRWRRRGPGRVMPIMTQAQVWALAQQPIAAEQEESLRSLFRSFRGAYRERLGIELAQ